MAVNANTTLLQSTISRDSGGKAVLRFVGTGSVLIAKAAANSDIAESTNTASNVVTGTITGMWWSLAAGIVTVARGSNTVAILAGTDHWNREGGFVALTEFPAANLAITFNAAAVGNGTLIIEMNKQYGTP